MSWSPGNPVPFYDNKMFRIIIGVAISSGVDSSAVRPCYGRRDTLSPSPHGSGGVLFIPRPH